MIWKASKMWEGETAFILAGGPSLKGFDATVLRGKGKVLTINDSWRLAPWANMMYFCDFNWWNIQQAQNKRAKWKEAPNSEVGFHDLIYKAFWVTSCPKFSEHPQLHYLKLSGECGLETDPSKLKHGANSGYQALNLAYHLGVKRIVLLGYDMHIQGTRTHWHDEPREIYQGFQVTLEKSFLPHFDALVDPLKEAGIEVLNSTPDSALKCWPYVPLEDVLDPKPAEEQDLLYGAKELV